MQVRLTGAEAGVRNIRFGKAVVATGGSAKLPPIPGIAEVPYHTNASLFNMTALPRRMVVIGAGPIGLEMAQSFALFGTEVTCVLRSTKLLPKEDPDAATIVESALQEDGVRFVKGIRYENIQVTQNDAGWSPANPCFDDRFPNIAVTVVDAATGERSVVDCDCLLVATGRKPNVNGLGLEAAGVEFDTSSGVKVDDLLRTTNPNIFAVGDVCSKFQFTHVSGTHAQMVVQNALFGGDRRVSDMVIPWATFTEPEVAHVGVYEHELVAEGKECDTYRANLAHNDRAILEGSDEGFVKIHCAKGTEEIIGATIVADAAGEMISELTVAIQFHIPLGQTGLGNVIHSYPTVADAVGGCAFGCKMKSWEKVSRADAASTELTVVPPTGNPKPLTDATVAKLKGERSHDKTETRSRFPYVIAAAAAALAAMFVARR